MEIICISDDEDSSDSSDNFHRQVSSPSLTTCSSDPSSSPDVIIDSIDDVMDTIIDDGQQSEEFNPQRHSIIIRQKFLLEEEKKAEQKKRKSSLSVLKDLKNADEYNKFGKYITEFVKTRNCELGTHGLRKGDMVSIYQNDIHDENYIASGIVWLTSRHSLEVTFDDRMYEFSDYPRLSIMSDRFRDQYSKITSAIEEMMNPPSVSRRLVSTIFGETEPLPIMEKVPEKLSDCDGDLRFFNDNLNIPQQEAVNFSLRRPDIAIIQGPPGTGKTTVLVESILQHVRLGCKVLAMAPSNLGVDGLVERLAEYGLKIVRIGHPARTTECVQKHTLDALVEKEMSDKRCPAYKNRKSLANLIKYIGEETGSKRRQTQEKIDHLRMVLERSKRKNEERLIEGAHVVFTTLIHAHQEGPLKRAQFDLTVIDECTQGAESSCYGGISKSPKLILAGDHKQLPPTVVSNNPALMKSLMERLIEDYGSKIHRMLTIQHRANKVIMNWSSSCFYDNQLVAHKTVANSVLCDLPGVANKKWTRNPLLLVDTRGCPGFEESFQSSDQHSISNEGEALLVRDVIHKMKTYGVNLKQISVITPYSAQVQLLRKIICSEFREIEVQSVDGFQGREKEVIILSLVRSNDQRDLGFLADERRLNVAVTRAKRTLCVVANSRTISSAPFLDNFLNYVADNGKVMKASELEEAQSRSASYSRIHSAERRHVDSESISKEKGNIKKET